MFEQFTKGARLLIVASDREAKALGHKDVGTEHVLLAVLRRTEPRHSEVDAIADDLEEIGVSLPRLEEAIRARGPTREHPDPKDRELPAMVVLVGRREEQLPARKYRSHSTRERREAFGSFATGGPIHARDVVVSILEQKNGEARRLMADMGVPIECVLATLAH